MEVITITKQDLQKLIDDSLQSLHDKIDRLEILLKGKPTLNVHEFAFQSGIDVRIIRKLASDEGYKGRRIEFYQLEPGGKITIPTVELVRLKRYAFQTSFDFNDNNSHPKIESNASNLFSAKS